MSSSLLLQRSPTWLVCLTWIVFEMGDEWSYSCYFVQCYFQDLFKIACSILVLFPSSFFSKCLLISMWCIHTVVLTQLQLGRNTVLYHQLDLASLWSTVYVLVEHKLTSLSVDEILLLRYVNLSTNFRSLSLWVEIAPSHLKHVDSVLFAFTG